jgi:energy-converting hydrogenase Eha subunit F
MEKRIKELELEVARLQGVIEGMKANPYHLYPRPYPVIPAPVIPVAPYPFNTPVWYQTYCTNNTNEAVGSVTTGNLAATGIN